MYWVVLGCALLVESWTEWILIWYARRDPSFLVCLLESLIAFAWPRPTEDI